MFPDLFRDDVFMLEARRLFLRWPKATDAPRIAELAGDGRVAEHTSHIPHPYPPEVATKFIIAARTANAAGERLVLAVAERNQPNRLIGIVQIGPDSEGRMALGYWLGAAYWGKGYMTEASQALIDAAFLYSQENEIVSATGVTNASSRKVLEKCGFQYAGGGMTFRPAWGDNVHSDHYRLTRSLWTSLKGWRAPLPTERADLQAPLAETG